MNQLFTIVPDFLRDPQAFYEAIGRGEAVGAKARALAISAITFLAAFGFVTGLSHSFWQALSSAAKMPMLFVATMFFCLPAFHFFSLILGTKLSIAQVTTIVLSAISVTAFLLLGLSPITLFFVLTSDNFAFFRLLAVIFVAVTGSIGVYFLWRGMAVVESNNGDSFVRLRRLLLWMWFVVYAFIGSQMTWRLSPFINDPSLPFEFIHPTHDNFYVDVLKALIEVTGVNITFELISPVLVGIACLVPLIAGLFIIATAMDKRVKAAPHPAPAVKTGFTAQ